MNELTAIQARVLGCLMEKKETTPEQYPLTLNALKNACNQKTARNPVTAYDEGDIGHTLRELESLGLVREAWGARVPKYEHHAGKVLELQSKGLALLCPLMLRGPQTLNELKINSHRLFEFDDLDDVQYMLQRLSEHEPSLVMTLPRQAGQKETRFAHLLCGEPDIPEPVARTASYQSSSGLASRVEVLEQEVKTLKSLIGAGHASEIVRAALRKLEESEGPEWLLSQLIEGEKGEAQAWDDEDLLAHVKKEAARRGNL